MKKHSCHACSDREAHARFMERADRLERENAGLRDRVENRTAVIAKTFDKICSVLEKLTYIDGDKQTAAGVLLSKLYAESDLLLAETIRAGIFSTLTAPELVSVLSAALFEGRKTENAPRIPHQHVQSALGELVSIWAKIEALEAEHGLKTQREPDFGFCWSSFHWAQGKSLSFVLKGTELSVGDFVRSIRQLIDLLNQIGKASSDLAAICKEAIKRIDRGVVLDMVIAS